MKKPIISNIKKSKSLREFLVKSRKKQFRKDFNNNNKLYLKSNSPNDIYKKINFNSFPSKDNSFSDPPTTKIKKKKYLYTKNKSTQLSYTHNSFSTKLYSSNNNNDSEVYPYNNIYLLEEIINKEKKKYEEKNKKMRQLILKKANEFLFSKKIKKNILNLDININKNNMRKTFCFSPNNNILNNKDKKQIENLFYIRKNLFPKTKKDNKFKKIKYVGDLVRNNNNLFKRYLLKKKENSEKLLFEIRKAQSMEIKNIQLGLALLKTKHKVYKCDRLLKYKYD